MNSSSTDDRVVVVLSTNAYVAFGVYFAVGTLYFCTLFLRRSYRGPCALWRPEYVTATTTPPQTSAPNNSNTTTNQTLTATSTPPTAAQLKQLRGAAPGSGTTTETHTMAPLTHRWAYIILHTAPINAIQQLRGYTEMLRYFGINCIQIILFLSYVDDGNTTLAGACAAIIMCLCTLAVICFIQSVRLIYHLDFLVMVLPRRNRTKEEIESEALGLAVGLADHTQDEMKRQEAAESADKKILDEATERFAASLRRRATEAGSSPPPPTADGASSAAAGGDGDASPAGEHLPSGSPMSVAVERMSSLLAENPGLILRNAKENVRRRREASKLALRDGAAVHDDNHARGGGGHSPSSPKALRSSTREPSRCQPEPNLSSSAIAMTTSPNQRRQGTMKELLQRQQDGSVSSPRADGVAPSSFANSVDDRRAAYDDDAARGDAYMSPLRPATECYDDENRSTSSSSPLSSTPLSPDHGSSSRSCLATPSAGTHGHRAPTVGTDTGLSLPRRCASDVDPRESAEARRREQQTTATTLDRHPQSPNGVTALATSQSARNLRSRSGSSSSKHPHTISTHSRRQSLRRGAQQGSRKHHHHHDDDAHHHHHHVHQLGGGHRAHAMSDLDISEIAVANILTKPASGSTKPMGARDSAKTPTSGNPPAANDDATDRCAQCSTPTAPAPDNNSFVSAGSFSYTQAEYAARLIAHLALEERLSYEQHEQRLGILMKMLSGNTTVAIRLMIFCLPPLLGMFHEIAMVVATFATVAIAVYTDRVVL